MGERYIQYNWVLLDAIGISYDEAADSDTGTGFSFMAMACILVGVLVLLAAGLVIYNILKISITSAEYSNSGSDPSITDTRKSKETVSPITASNPRY